MTNTDRLIQGMAGNGDFRILAAQTSTTVETARSILDLSPVAADALGRALTGSLLLARLLNKDLRNQYVTLRFEGSGPLGTVIAEATISGHARGYVANPAPPDATLERIRKAPPLSTLIEKMPIEAVVALVLEGMQYKQIDESFNVPLSYTCTCSRERALAPLALFSPEERREMVNEGGSEVVCQYCGRKYSFTADDLLALTATPDA